MQQARKKGFAFIPLLIIFSIIILLAVYFARRSGFFKTDPQIKDSAITAVESVFREYEQEYDLYIGKGNDFSMWWVSKDGWNIINDDSLGLKINIPCNDDPFEEDKENYDLILRNIVGEVDKLMVDRDFSVNVENTSPSFEDEKFYDYIKAYEKDGKKCVVVGNPDCTTSSIKDYRRAISFMCTQDYKENYSKQKPYLEDLGINDRIIRITKKVGDFVYLTTHWRRAGHYIIAKNIDGKWEKVVGGQEKPTCKSIIEYKVPDEITEECYDTNLEEIVDNPN